MDTKISEEEKQGLKVQQDSRALSLNDLKEFSRALDLYDNGKNAEARSLAIGLQKRYPQFAPINNLVKKL